VAAKGDGQPDECEQDNHEQEFLLVDHRWPALSVTQHTRIRSNRPSTLANSFRRKTGRRRGG
jgi:hypothetical protein